MQQPPRLSPAFADGILVFTRRAAGECCRSSKQEDGQSGPLTRRGVEERRDEDLRVEIPSTVDHRMVEGKHALL